MALTHFQVQQILAGHIAKLRLPDHVIVDCLNNGWKGESLKCRRVATGEIEVVRILSLDKLLGLGSTDQERRQRFEPTMSKLRALDHPLISKLCPSEIHGDLAIVAAEHIDGVMLGSEVHKIGGYGKERDWERVLSSAIDLATSVAHLHQASILHLDLSCYRFVRKADNRLCLLDPGICGLLLPSRWEDIPAVTGLPPILAPEVRGDFSAASPAADIYALGHVFRFLRSGEFPFKSLKISDLPPCRPQVHPAAALSLETRDTVLGKLRGVPAPRSSPRWDDAFDSLADEMTQEKVEFRIRSVDEVLQRLHHILHNQSRLSAEADLGLTEASITRPVESAEPDPPAGPPISGSGFLGRRIRQFFKRV